MLVADTHKIAVLRANALGDFVFLLPALHALRAAYPLAEIMLLGKAWHADFLADRPSPIDRVVVTPPSKGVNEPAGQEDPVELEHFFSQMRSERLDIALQMHGGGRNSNPFVLNLGARLTAGMKTPDAPSLDRSIPYIYWQHEMLRLLEVVALVGAPPVFLEPRLEVTGRDLRESCQALPDDSEQPLVVLHPGASDPRRRWSAEKYADVGDHLARAGNRVAVVGIPSEAPVVDQVIQSMHAPAANLSGKLSLQGLTGLLKRAVLVIANDSGPRHLAEAVGTPTVGIYWCGNVVNAGSFFRTHHRPQMSWTINCPVCGQNTLVERCQHDVSFVDEVTVDEVLSNAFDLLRN